MSLFRISALSVPAFRRLCIAWLFTNFGDSLLFLTAAIWVKDLTGSNSAAGLVFLALGLPVFLAPIAGYVADRMSRKRLVIAANLLLSALVLSLFLVRTPGDVWLIYLVALGYGLLTYVNSAAQSGLLRDLLSDEQLAPANGLLTTVDQGLRILSPLVGAGLYAALGGPSVAVTTSVALVIGVALIARVHVVETPPTAAEDRESFGAEFTAGVRHIRRLPALARLTLLMAVVFMATGLMNSTIFAALEDGFGVATEFFGVLASIQGGGSIVGGLTAAAIIARLGEQRTVALGFAGLTVGLLTVLTGMLPVAFVGSFVGGAAIPWMVVGFVTFRQRTTPAQLQGRVSAASNMALNGPQTIGTAAGAYLVAVVDWRFVVIGQAIVMAACALPLLVHARVPVVEDTDEAVH